MTQRVVEKASDLLERRISRSGFLARVTLAGAALTVGPLRYLLKPGTAYASICNCPIPTGAGSKTWGQNESCDCTQNCCDGYTVFCCTINGGPNTCPSGTFIGGWWLCASSAFCPSGDPMYYLDCNATCSGTGCGCSGSVTTQCKTGANPWCANTAGSYQCIGSAYVCKCANGSCSNRAESCNWFRYGQCNTGTQCSGPVVCRVASCLPPWQNFNCNSSSCSDPNTCSHTASCL